MATPKTTHGTDHLIGFLLRRRSWDHGRRWVLFHSLETAWRTKNARLHVANKKSEVQSKALDKALNALAKFELDSYSTNAKDWGDVIRWVLPTAKVDFLLKDLNEETRDASKVLDNLHTSYATGPGSCLCISPNSNSLELLLTIGLLNVNRLLCEWFWFAEWRFSAYEITLRRISNFLIRASLKNWSP